MALTPYDPLRNLDVFRRGLDRFFHEIPAMFSFGEGIGVHRVDVYETEHEVVASCEVPGLEKKEDVQIDVHGDVLTIAGVIHRSSEVKEEQLVRSERFTGRFQRQISLPTPVKEEGITATYKNGILEVRMPKASPGERRRIDVQFH
jgi:HSP20 family protein